MRDAKKLAREIDKLSRRLGEVFEDARELEQESKRLRRQLESLIAQAQALEGQDTIETIRPISRRAPKKPS